MNNHIKFCLNMIHKYEVEYPQIPTDILADIIDVTLNRAPDNYFTYNQVQEHPEFCNRCGKCCEEIGFCDDFNGKTCEDYEGRFDACREYPWYDINNECGLILDCECHFANRLAEMVLDEEIQKNADLLNLD